MPKISVIICAYNAAEFLEASVKSVLNQSFGDIELIIVNDGSTDSTPDIAEAFALADRRVSCISTPNGGLSCARNIGMNAASGEYIAFCDADDYIASGCFEAMLQKASEHNCDVVVSGYFLDTYLSGGKIHTVNVSPKEAFYKDKAELLKDFRELKSNYIFDPSWNKLYKRSFVLSNGFSMPVGELYEDTSFCLQVLDKAENIFVMSSCFYHYIQRKSGSITKSFNIKKSEFLKKRYYEMLSFVGDNEALKAFAGMYHLRNMYSSISDVFASRLKHAEKKSFIASIISDEAFKQAALSAEASSLSDRLTLFTAKSGSLPLSFAFGRGMRFLKYNLRVLFLKLRR